MNIYLHELKIKLKSAFIWTGAVLFYSLIIVGFAPTMIELGDELSTVVESMGALAEVMNMDLSTFTTLTGIMSMYFGMLMICFGIQAANYGFGLVTIEESELTADFLLTKPVKRGVLLTSKMLASLTALLITSLLFAGVTYSAMVIFAGEYIADHKALILLLLSAVLYQLFFFFVSILVSLFFKKVKSVVPFSMAFAFGMFIIGGFSRSFEIEFLEYINPFSYFDSAEIAKTGTYDGTSLLICGVIIAVSICFSYVIYRRRDIGSV